VRRFFEAIRPWLEQRNGGRERRFSLEVADTGEVVSLDFAAHGLQLGDQPQTDHVLLTRQQWTSVVFGEHLSRRVVIPPSLRDLFPFYFPLWILDQS